MKHRLVLFDLDGTLADTAPDLGYALNLQRERHGLEALPDEVIRPYASHGSKGLLGIGFGIMPDAPDFSEKRIEYLALYEQVFTEHTRLFEGATDVLEHLGQIGLPWGIVTNKPRRFTVPLVKALGLSPACVVSGDDAAQPKPAPDTLLLACKLANAEPKNAIYVGDAERDIVAGKAAGMHTVVALYGYLSKEDKPLTWGANDYVNSPLELLKLLE